MKLLDAIQIPWTPYALTFSRDGTRLAIGGGTWYGNGGIIIRRLAQGISEHLHWTELRDDETLFPVRIRASIEHWTSGWRNPPCTFAPTGIPAVSSLCFSDDDQYLAASLRRAGVSYAPTAVFHVNDTKLTLGKMIEGQDAWHVVHTGVLLQGNYLVVLRHSMGRSGDVLAIDELPSDWNLVATGAFDHLTHSRVVVRRGDAIAAEARMASPIVITTSRLMLKGLDGNSTEYVPIRDSHLVTAISATRDQGFVTAGANGEIDAWAWDDGWRQTRLRKPQDDDCIHEVVCTAAGRLVAVTVGGTLIVDPGQADSRTWKIPLKNFVRSLAAHPSKETIVVGFKGGGFVNPPSELAVVELG